MVQRDDYGRKADDYFASIKGDVGRLAAELRALVLNTAPGLNEVIKWGMPVYQREDGGGWVCSLRAGKDYVALQFGVNGSRLDDPLGLLEGTGKDLRHVKIRSARDLHPQQFASWIRQAAKVGNQGLGD